MEGPSAATAGGWYLSRGCLSAARGVFTSPRAASQGGKSSKLILSPGKKIHNVVPSLIQQFGNL